MRAAEGSRLLREKQQLKIPQEAVFADEELKCCPRKANCPEWKSMLQLRRSSSNMELIATKYVKRANH
ncbi:hypothetical protein FCL54_00230 [Pseudalkalibacillus caeni]|uniref:Uncharacterized protein n=1 Tax=Exobacillus caeni TaxID=2574798 RepID=A0A5R9FET6_9BACL|nr:hypothetical protein FCL54_00230 [Pseudalkalibacillus caeni]